MMHSTTLRLALTFVLSLVSISLAAPALDSATLLQNGQNAQTLNAEFRQISLNDPCNSGQTACLNGTTAVCQSGSWKQQRCPDSKKCFAIPSVTSVGTQLVCTSEANALSLIQATGAKGGIAASNNDTVPFPTTSLLPSPSASSSVDNTNSSASPSATPADDGVNVVTVTVTAAPTTSATPITLPPTTTTLDSAGLDSLLSSMSAQGVVFVTAAASTTPSISAASYESLSVGDSSLPTATVSPSGNVPDRQNVAIKIAAWRRNAGY